MPFGQKVDHISDEELQELEFMVNYTKAIKGVRMSAHHNAVG